MSLFAPDTPADQPLAERMRPRTLDEFSGQEHIIGPGKPLRRQLENGQLASVILWGPPGVGKTTLARLMAQYVRGEFIPFSAVLGGVKEIRAVMADAARGQQQGQRTVVFVDEIHRFNKAQQDAFLPAVEKGEIVLIGATTENPSFEVNAALLSRMKVYALRALSTEEIVSLLRRALTNRERGLGALEVQAEDSTLAQIALYSDGDARAAYNLVELAATTAPHGVLTPEHLADTLQRKTLRYDKAGEEHFNLVSALHKSVRSSDADGALYWLGRMLHAGEDRLYLARRLVRMAVEDIGLADPRALEQAIAAMQAVHFLGVPEGDQALAQITIYLAVAPKSDAAYQALKAVTAEIESGAAPPVPMQLRNAPTRAMKSWGYGQGYEHAHGQPDALTRMSCLPDSLAGRHFYEPTERGTEKRISEKLREIREWRESVASTERDPEGQSP